MRRLGFCGIISDTANEVNWLMTQIILNKEQVQALQGATDGVQFRDAEGNLLGYIARPFTSERIADAKRRAESDGPWYTTEQVLKHLASLDQE